MFVKFTIFSTHHVNLTPIITGAHAHTHTQQQQNQVHDKILLCVVALFVLLCMLFQTQAFQTEDLCTFSQTTRAL